MNRDLERGPTGRSAPAVLLALMSLMMQPAAASAQSQSAAASSSAEVSTIAIPIRASLRPLLPILESQVLSSVNRTAQWEVDPEGRFAMKYQLMRGPIALNMIGTGLHATTTVRYALEGCGRARNPFTGQIVLFPCGSCGFSEPMRQAEISIDSRLEWDPSWRLRSITRARPVEFPDRCQVTFARVDITDWKIAPAVNQQLQQAVRTIDANTPALTVLRAQAASAWSALQNPEPVGPGSWLVLEPLDVAFTPIRGSGLEVTSTLLLRARTRIVVGSSAPAVNKKPLPMLGRAAKDDSGLRVPVEIDLPYAEASRMLTERFGHRRYGEVVVSTIELARGHAGKVLVRLDVDYRASAFRKYRGLVDLEGTAVYLPSTRSVALVDVDYALDPGQLSLFLRVADGFTHNRLRTQLAQSTQWPIGPQLDLWRSQISSALTRSLGQGAILQGSVSSLEPAIASIDDHGILLRIVAVGQAEVRLPGK